MVRSTEESLKSSRLAVLLFSIIATLCLVAGCGKSTEVAEAKPLDPVSIILDDPDLTAGQKTWASTCTTCHLTGLTGAPIIGNKDAWAPRIAKGLETLYSHAINGFIGPDYKEMPPKGGFAELTDEQVKQAVRFMTHLSK